MLLGLEHGYLGARFSEEEGARMVESYAGEPEDAAAATTLTDLTGSAYLLVSGPASPVFCAYALAGEPLAVGECAWSAALAADGALVSAPLSIRTGDGEQVIIDLSPRSELLLAWLGFVSEELAHESALAAGCSVEDATELLAPLMLRGPEAREVLSDYLHDGQSLPAPGQVASLALDRIVCVVCALDESSFALFVPPAAAVTLWRSFLSFPQVEPLGLIALRGLVADGLAWGGHLRGEGRIEIGLDRLRSWGLVRPGDGFIGY